MARRMRADKGDVGTFAAIDCRNGLKASAMSAYIASWYESTSI